MKTKSKMIASIMSICLVCAVFAIGVFALKTANLKIGGDVSFSATGVEAHIKNASLTGLATTNQEIAANDADGEVINTTTTQSDIDAKFATWQNLTLDFNENADDIVFKFDIANTSTNADNYIEIDYDYSFSIENPNVAVVAGDNNAEQVWENNNYILTPKGSAESATYETITLKFKVIDKELNVPENTKVNLRMSLKHIVPKTATASNNVVIIDNIKYSLDTNAKTASVTGHTFTSSGVSAVVYPIVSDGTDDYIVTNIGSMCFLDDIRLAGITIPNSVTTFKNYAFSTPSLSSINFPRSLLTIGSYAFSYTSLSHITIPSSVTHISRHSFDHITSAEFEEIEGWVASTEEDASNGEVVEISPTDFEANATILKETYYFHYWYRTI